MSDVKISVVIPLYNGSDKIIKCLTMLDRQTFEDNYEVIIVDDCSSDNSVEVVEQLLSTLKNKKAFNLIRHDVNGRAGKARNTGIKAADGEYILFIDQDDYPDHELLKTLYCLTENGKYDCVYCDVLDRNGNEYHRAEANRLLTLNETDRNILMQKCGYVFSMLIRRDIIKDNNLYFPEKVMFEDVLYNIGILTCVNSVNSTNRVLYYRTDDERSQTARLTNQKIQDRIKAVHFYLDNYRDNKNTQPYLATIKETAFYYVYLSVVWWMIFDNSLYSKELFNQAISEGRQLNVDWNSVVQTQRQLKPIAVKILKLAYNAPWTYPTIRSMGRAYYKLIHSNYNSNRGMK